MESVHLETSPKTDTHTINPELEHRMEHVIRIVGLVRAMRMKSNLKVRQPLRKIILPVKSEADRKEIGIDGRCHHGRNKCKADRICGG